MFRSSSLWKSTNQYPPKNFRCANFTKLSSEGFKTHLVLTGICRVVCRLSIWLWECTSQTLGLCATRRNLESWTQTGWRNPRKMSYKWGGVLNERTMSPEKWTGMQGWTISYKSCRIYLLVVTRIRVILHNYSRQKFCNPTKFKNFLGTDLKNHSKM